MSVTQNKIWEGDAWGGAEAVPLRGCAPGDPGGCSSGPDGGSGSCGCCAWPHRQLGTLAAWRAATGTTGPWTRVRLLGLPSAVVPRQWGLQRLRPEK